MGPRAAALLEGMKLLVLEDEALVSFLAEDMLKDLGCAVVWHASSVNQALDLLDQRRPDAAVLDVNLAGGAAYPVAARLVAMTVPFLFATGYGRVLDQWAAHPVIAKPFKLTELEAALIRAFARKT
jgi:DNA-binding response OmpR family regulator